MWGIGFYNSTLNCGATGTCVDPVFKPDLNSTRAARTFNASVLCFVLTVLVGLGWVGLGFSITASLIAPTCRVYPSTGFCAPYVSPNVTVYTPAGKTFDEVENQVKSQGYILAVVPRLRCRDTLARFMCTAAFPTCSFPLAPLGLPLSVAPFPSLACKSVCNDVVDACGADLAAQFGVNCSAQTPTARVIDCSTRQMVMDVTPPRDDYPAVGTAWGALAGVPISTTCELNAYGVGKPGTTDRRD
jgi:hypothetical protein